MNNLLKFCYSTKYDLCITFFDKISLIIGWRPYRLSFLTDQLCFQFSILRDEDFKWFYETHHNGTYKFINIHLLSALKFYAHYIPPAKVK